MREFKWKFVVRVIGFVLIIESIFLFISSGVSFYYKEYDFNGLLISALITLVAGTLLAVSSGIRKKVRFIGKRESYFCVASSWLFFALFGSLPFFISGAIPSFTNAFFESTSGITTTGASVLDNIESIPHGLLFWRSLLQWLGGMGIIVFSLALLPLLGGSATQLFDAEVTGLTQEKFQPRVSQMAKRIWGIYLSLTLATILLLWAGPMEAFDAICHGLTTISTGGFSTKQESIAHWDSLYVEGVTIAFMLLGAINFVLLYYAIKGRFKKIIKDEELRWFFGIIVIAIVAITAGLIHQNQYSATSSLRHAAFEVVSIFTTTGFSSIDFSGWGAFILVIFIFLMVVCGSAGSTSGGLKTVRAVVLAKEALVVFKRLIHPRAIIPVRLNGTALSFRVVQQLLAFVFLYIAIIFISWFILALLGMTFNEALSSSISAISNIGPAFGESISTTDSYASVPTVAKWYLCFLMIVGRLEIFTVLILFTPGFWKR